MTMLSLPLAAVGSILFIWMLGYNMSVAIWVGIIALMGVAIQDTMVMVVFLDEAWALRKSKGELNNLNDCYMATSEGALKSLRSIVMDLVTDFIGLLPVMLAVGLGADVMKRLSAPMFGGLILLMFFILIVIPCVYLVREQRVFLKQIK
jgi:Cu(I)/Ag(I) efflux system membrane protein CusA/SilA